MSLELYPAEVRFDRPRVSSPREAVAGEMAKLRESFAGKKSIAVAVGSRGIANLALIVREAVASLRTWGCEPFIVPAMGSHGGATAEGQAAVLASYGVTEQEIGCPIRSSMEVKTLPASMEIPLYMDAHAAAAEGILLINRIKPHTDFHGRYESGLVKMAVIGLGKEKQAHQIHCYGTFGLRELIPAAAAEILRLGKITAGLAIIENAYDETALVEAVPVEGILSREPELLEMARRNMPSLPVDALDVLIVDELGKNISGTGMDTNIIGRIRIPGEPEPARPRIGAILVDGITEESHGNATGMGLADVVTKKFLRRIDWEATNRNIITSGFLERGKLPVVADNAAHAFELASRSCGMVPEKKLRVLRIKNTLHLNELCVSHALLQTLRDSNRVVIEREAQPAFDDNGSLCAGWA